MEVTIIQFNSIAGSTLVLVNDKLVVQTELAFGRPGQISTHLDAAVYIRAENSACDQRYQQKMYALCSWTHL